MGREDQIEEREVLDSIFPEEITGEYKNPKENIHGSDISDTAYRISIALETPENDVEETEQPVLVLQVSYPPDYPDVAPELDLSAPPNAPKHPRLDIQEDRDQLLETLQPAIEENIGMAMVFTLVSALKESAEQLMSERVNAVHAQKEREAAKAEEEENRKFQGTAVTRESFLKWQAGFKQEIEDEERRQKEEKEADDKRSKTKTPAKEEKKMTGRELWERGLAGKADFDEDEEDSMPPVEKMKIAA
ncbi:RWD-domain-containing protein [Aspergillus steynii IBT 23096]|uniref:RWD-domain-containing protein n=1 Tax=Aspergillus steynii IBT 23096 TaxID=1392250 RepID=A0A2I2GQH8_9EURO|nr:RWD-domain-containing protein [Aspergillus steynii IBT 23096]PLB55136.1 RWD-domain-containing protein [Aspergillus steynii IBT 23096]